MDICSFTGVIWLNPWCGLNIIRQVQLRNWQVWNSFFLKSERFCILKSTVDLHPMQISEVKNKYELRVNIQGVPLNMRITWRLLYRLRSMWHFYMNTIIAVFQFTHLISKTPGLEIFKMRSSTIFVFTKLTTWYISKYVQTSIYLINKNCLNI